MVINDPDHIGQLPPVFTIREQKVERFVLKAIRGLRQDGGCSFRQIKRYIAETFLFRIADVNEDIINYMKIAEVHGILYQRRGMWKIGPRRRRPRKGQRLMGRLGKKQVVRTAARKVGRKKKKKSGKTGKKRRRQRKRQRKARKMKFGRRGLRKGTLLKK